MTPAELLARYDAAALAERLSWLLKYLRNHEDVYDGSDGTPRPNEAMRIASEYTERFPEGVRGPYIWPQVPMQERRSVIRAAAPKDKP